MWLKYWQMTSLYSTHYLIKWTKTPDKRIVIQRSTKNLKPNVRDKLTIPTKRTKIKEKKDVRMEKYKSPKRLRTGIRGPDKDQDINNQMTEWHYDPYTF